MIVNHLFVVPSDDTIDYFNRIKRGCPFEIHPETFKISLMYSLEEITTDPLATYTATPGSMKLYYNEEIQGSSLYLPLISPDLVNEHGKLMSDGMEPAFTPFYSPNIRVVQGIPPLKRFVRSWINSLSTILRNDQTLLEFGMETVEVLDLDREPDHYYRLEMEKILNNLHHVV